MQSSDGSCRLQRLALDLESTLVERLLFRFADADDALSKVTLFHLKSPVIQKGLFPGLPK
jgi:hypothetical protein